MPIYEFECEQCHNRFERLVLPSEDRKPPCPKCNGENIRKLMSACRNVTLKIPAGYGGGAKPPACTPGG
ncbi:MAG: zinc ribbon domain-containing protein [Desulfobacteraceae bacterium]|nr:MAG: zinc ribbon domain-containing protein [Desulfobacteraceae bacterium]